MSQSHVSPRFTEAPPLTTPPAATEIGQHAQASGLGGAGLSRPTSAPPDPPADFSSVSDAALDTVRIRHNNMLIAFQRHNLFHALRQQPGVDAHKVEAILHALIENNEACAFDKPATRCHLYMGFGDVNPLDRQAFAELAKQLREAAYAVWSDLKDPACQQMLDWIARDWALCERSLQSPGMRASMYRLQLSDDDGANVSTNTDATTTSTTDTTNTTTTTTTTDTVDPPLHREKMQDASALKARARLRDGLITALRHGDTATVSALLATLPPGVEYLTPYLPPAPASGDYAAALGVADRYMKNTRTSRGKSLHAFVFAAYGRSVGAMRVKQDQKSLTVPDLDRLCAPATRQLCQMLNDIAESDLGACAPRLSTLITQALKDPLLEVDLLRQPYANLKMVMLKCTLLAEHLDKSAVAQLRQHAHAAHKTQLKHTQLLRLHLLETPCNASAVATLALTVYARGMTTTVADHVSAGAVWKDVNAFARNIRQVYAHYLQNPGLGKAEMAALRWVRERILYTEKLTH